MLMYVEQKGNDAVEISNWGTVSDEQKHWGTKVGCENRRREVNLSVYRKKEEFAMKW